MKPNTWAPRMKVALFPDAPSWLANIIGAWDFASALMDEGKVQAMWSLLGQHLLLSAKMRFV